MFDIFLFIHFVFHFPTYILECEFPEDICFGSLAQPCPQHLEQHLPYWEGSINIYRINEE